jgi:general secretion pathway protein J
VEALASLVIVGMIGLMLTAGMATGRRVWDRIDQREASGEALDSAQTIVRDRIEQIYPATLYDRNPPYIDFQGTAEAVTFLANPSDAGRPAPLRRYSLSLDAKGELLLSSVSDVSPDGAAVDKQVLLRGVRQLEMAYFGPVFPDEQERWRREWHDEAALPETILVRVDFAPDDARRWPDLVIRTRTTIDSLCLLNPVTHHCKGRV